MPVKQRAPKLRRPQFSAEAIALFSELERVRPSRRYEDPRSQRLASLLGLSAEYWTVNHVSDLDPICHPEGYLANNHWRTCQEVRLALLQATAHQPTRQP